MKGVVLRVDAFGNLMTNLTAEDIPVGALGGGAIKIAVNGKEVCEVRANICAGQSGEAMQCLAQRDYWRLR